MNNTLIKLAIGSYLGTYAVWYLLYRSPIGKTFTFLGPITDPGNPMTGAGMAFIGSLLAFYAMDYMNYI